MVNELDTPTFGSFSIDETRELGLGSKELLQGLYAPETATSEPDDVEKIELPKKEVKKPSPKKEDIKEEKVDKNAALDSFLENEEEEEEEGEKKEKVENKTPKEQEKDVEVDNTQPEDKFSALAKDLFKLGVFSEDEEDEGVEIKSPEQLLARFQAEKQKGAMMAIDDFIGKFGEDYQHAFQAIYVKGVSPKEYFGVYNNIEDISELDLKDEGNQIAILKQGLTELGMEQEDIKTEIEKIKNYGDLESAAGKYHKVLIKKEAQKLAQLEKDSALKLQQQSSIRTQYVTNVNTVLQDKLKTKEFDGIPINPKLATEVQDFLITDRYKLPSGETITEFDKTILDLKRPENHIKKVKVALLLKVLEKDPTLSTIQKSGITKKTDTLFSSLVTQDGKPSKNGKTETSPNKSWFS